MSGQAWMRLSPPAAALFVCLGGEAWVGKELVEVRKLGPVRKIQQCVAVGKPVANQLIPDHLSYPFSIQFYPIDASKCHTLHLEADEPKLEDTGGTAACFCRVTGAFCRKFIVEPFCKTSQSITKTQSIPCIRLGKITQHASSSQSMKTSHTNISKADVAAII